MQSMLPWYPCCSFLTPLVMELGCILQVRIGMVKKGCGTCLVTLIVSQSRCVSHCDRLGSMTKAARNGAIPGRVGGMPLAIVVRAG